MDAGALHQDFEKAWKGVNRSLRSRFLYSGVSADDVDDLLQDVAKELWDNSVKRESIPESFPTFSRDVAKHVLLDFRRRRRKSKEETQPPDSFEKQSVPFADLWGRPVPNINSRFAEDYSIAPLDWPPITPQLESIIGKNTRFLYYLSIGLSIGEISNMTGLPVKAIRDRLSRVKNQVHGLLESQGIIPILSPPISYWDIMSRLVLPPAPTYSWWGVRSWEAALHAMRQLHGYHPEWSIWLRSLLEHTATTNEPITFGVVRRLARHNPILTEEQGRRFLLAVSAEGVDLLEQKFMQIESYTGPRFLSFSNIYQALRGESRDLPPQSYACGDEWLEQVITFWEPTLKWSVLAPW